ncbi:MAG: type III pantothenate kinase [Bdellovibrionales bacterium]|nr:type III pantothenate kinase [Bdellovibrionales bacterium]
MILCLDVGNSQIYGGVFTKDQLMFRFRKNSKGGFSSDEFGIFLRSVLRENGINPDHIHQIALCSVVPEVIHSIRNCCLKYFNKSPFILQAGVKTGLKIKYKNPLEVGSDRIANAIAASHLYPDKDIIIIDFGTATTFCVLSKNKEYLGGTILAGLRISMEALETRTSKLPSVEIVVPERCVGKTTVEGIQSGLYFGTLGMIKEIKRRIIKEEFNGNTPQVIGTGGFASLFKEEDIFDIESPDLVLQGLHLSLMMNV